ncbi:hypothetical protein CFD26_100564 [Aspergillus turcosus]|uniref:Glucose-methanol-choline oxidoreductase N-terminal domain-containing protein n=1 Tax=Aspergillus turcosus TaxID=1245748 RepID=A0A3R7GCI8_9EURO|nr:hypothetical protein CFD26_100564 [Aspergillus turcosus]
MASLINNVNPYCRLYIARVGKGREDIDPKKAAMAIDWAVEQKVDIISMSWVTKTQEADLQNAVKRAADNASNNKSRPTLMFCSTADEGAFAGEVYPVDYADSVVSVAATDTWGGLTSKSDRQKPVDIRIPGEDLEAPVPQYLENVSSRVSGSSVATALAAGIASLALLLLRTYNDNNADLRPFYTKKGIMRVFNQMDASKGPLQIQHLFPRDPVDPSSLDAAAVWDGRLHDHKGRNPVGITRDTGLGGILLRDINNALPTRDQETGLFQVPIAVKTVNSVNADGSRKYHLDIQLNTLVTNVRFDMTNERPRAIGVDYLRGQSLYRADPRASKSSAGTPGSVNAAKEVIHSAGAFNTPQLLKLSGLGPKEELSKWNIITLVDLPGVGKNLQDRYETGVVGKSMQFSRKIFDDLVPLDGGFEEVWPGPNVTTEAELKDFIKREAWGHHACCTAAIGADEDPNAVLDLDFRVRGVCRPMLEGGDPVM